MLPSARAHHYSNLAYGLLGEVVARASGVPYARLVEERVLGPLGLERTTWSPRPPFAQGYLVDEYAGTAAREPHIELGGVAAMGQLWSTVGYLCGLASFLAGDGGGILEPASLEQMWTLQSVVDPERWSVGYGLGLELSARDGRGLRRARRRDARVPPPASTSTASRGSAQPSSPTRARGLASRELCLELASTTIERWPAAIPPWQPEREPPADVRAILGRWWSEGNEFVFSWREGKLTAALPGSPPWVHPSVFAPLGDGSFRVVEGRERGERLRPVEGGMVFGGYLSHPRPDALARVAQRPPASAKAATASA